MTAQFVDHLWQSTVFAIVAVWLAFLLRSNRAKVRYWLWMAASLKFLVPFAWLVQLGSQLSWRAANQPQGLPLLFQLAAEPITSPFAHGVQVTAPVFPWVTFASVVWAVGAVIVGLYWWKRSLSARAAARSARNIDLKIGVPVKSSPVLMEPAVLGVFRPILLLPEGFAERLDPEQLQAILTHELSHIRRRDNLFSALHMIVEMLFWFHPLVWWLGARMVEERERACDEEVILQGNDSSTYAAGLLEVCKLYFEAPVACVAGVTGGVLSKRIRAILSSPAENLTLSKKFLVVGTAIAAVAMPLGIGLWNAPPLRAQSSSARVAFEVASIKEHKSGNGPVGYQNLPGGKLHVLNLSPQLLISLAYNLPFQGPSRISGGPEWIRTARYDIEAAAEPGVIPAGASGKTEDQQVRLMLQTLLAERFKLVVRRELKEMPVYEVVVGRGGPKLAKANMTEKDCVIPNPDDPARVYCHSVVGGQGRGLHGKAATIADIANFTTNWSDRPIVEKTGISELFVIETEGWTPLTSPAGAPGNTSDEEAKALADPSRLSLFGVYEQMGLHLQAQRAPIEMFVVESASKPTEN